MEDKLEELDKLNQLKKMLEDLEEDKKLTENELKTCNYDYCKKKDLENDLLYINREILNAKKEIKILELFGVGKRIR